LRKSPFLLISFAAHTLRRCNYANAFVNPIKGVLWEEGRIRQDQRMGVDGTTIAGRRTQRPALIGALENVTRGLAIAATTAAAVAAATAAITTVTTAAATTTTAAAAKTTTTTTRAILARFGFVNVQRTTVDFLAIKLSDSCLALFLAGHFDEAEAA
jgi:hypothetical protein